MSLSFGSSKQETQQQQKSQTDPWDVATPYVKDLLKKTKGASAQVGATADQTAAYEQLKSNAQAGNPYAGQLDTLATDLLTGKPATNAYGELDKRLSPTADGQNMNLEGNAYLQGLLKQVGDDVQWRTNRQFAGAGRDLSGINQNAVARGVTSAQLPLLLDQYNTEQQRTDTAARDLFGASNTAATTDAALRTSGTAIADKAMEARDYGPNTILNLEEQMKKMPYDELSWLAELIYPAAGLGQQSTGSGTSTSKGTQFGAKADAGSAAAQVLSLLSDARVKTDVKRVGTLFDGQPIYSYRLLGGPETHIGLLAQEVEQSIPDAVTEFGGIKHVDYARATEAAAQVGATP